MKMFHGVKILGSGKIGQWFIGKVSLDREANKYVTSFKNHHSLAQT